MKTVVITGGSRGIGAAAVEAFDATFPPKEKKWMPSQEEFYIYSHSSVVR